MVPPLTPLHADESLILSKLDLFRKVSTEEIKKSLEPGQQGSLKARLDGTMLDGHHRVRILRERGVNVDALPREIVSREDEPC